MACSQYWGHCVALNIYFVDSQSGEAVENLSTATQQVTRNISPILQVRATREETFGSVIHRATLMMHNPGSCPIGSSYYINTIAYNGLNLDKNASMNLPIGQVLNDPRTNLLILNGTLTSANCCCMNYCIVSCCTGGEPKYEGPKYVNITMNSMNR